jgi:hypothetical protein
MSNERPSFFMPALIGGGIAGVLTAIPFVNCLCCLWIIGGAMLSVYLISKDSKVALTSGDGAIVGALAGVIASIVDFFVSMPFQAMSDDMARNIMEKVSEYTEEMPQGWEGFLEGGGFEASMAMNILGLLIAAVVFSILGALGGILGMSIFGKKFFPAQGNITIDVPKEDSNAKDPSDRQP